MITIFTWFGYELLMKDSLKLIKQAGFDGVTLWWGEAFAFEKIEYRNIPALARKTGLYIENIHTPFDKNINNFWLDNPDGDILTDSFLRMVDDCSEYDIPTMVVHLSSGDNPPPFSELGLDRIKRIIEKAEKQNINIVFENLRHLQHLEYILDNIDSSRAGFCYDSGHQHCRNLNVDLLSRYGSRLKALHLHDNDGYISGSAEEDQHLLPFDGTIDWPVTMKKIAQTGYTGSVALEVIHRGYENLPPEDFLLLAFERAKKLKIFLREPI